MKNDNKRKIIVVGTMSAGILTAMGVLGSLGIGSVLAQEGSDDYPSIVQKIAERFNLNPSEVNDVFVEEKEARVANRLHHLVENGEITEDKIDMIVAKMEEMHSEMDDLRDSDFTHEERMEYMEELRNEMEEWAEENDIPISALRGPGMKMGRGDHIGGMWHGQEE